MSRPKGSKNKPKIVMGFGTKVTGKINPHLEETERIEEVKGTEKVEIKGAEIKETEVKKAEVKEKKDKANINLSLDLTQPVQPIQALPVQPLNDSLTTSSLNNLSEEIKKIKKSSNKTYPCCERCGQEIKSEPRKIDFNILTGVADYHRATPRYLKMCNDCCKELSQIVDKWLLEGPCGDEIKKKGW